MEDLGTFLEKMDSLSPEEMFSQYLDKNWNHYQTGVINNIKSIGFLLSAKITNSSSGSKFTSDRIVGIKD